MKVAIFKSVSGYTCAYDHEAGEAMVKYQRYTRITEYVEVDFPPLPLQAVVEGQLAALSDAETELRNQFETRLNEIKTERAKLLSLTHQPDVPDVMA